MFTKTNSSRTPLTSIKCSACNRSFSTLFVEFPITKTHSHITRTRCLRLDVLTRTLLCTLALRLVHSIAGWRIVHLNLKSDYLGISRDLFANKCRVFRKNLFLEKINVCIYRKTLAFVPLRAK